MTVLDITELVERLGPAHSCMHWGLIKVVFARMPRGRPP